MIVASLFISKYYRYMELEAKLAQSNGISLETALTNADRASFFSPSNKSSSFSFPPYSGMPSQLGDQTRAAAMASAGGQRR